MLKQSTSDTQYPPSSICLPASTIPSGCDRIGCGHKMYDQLHDMYHAFPCYDTRNPLNAQHSPTTHPEHAFHPPGNNTKNSSSYASSVMVLPEDPHSSLQAQFVHHLRTEGSRNLLHPSHRAMQRVMVLPEEPQSSLLAHNLHHHHPRKVGLSNLPDLSHQQSRRMQTGLERCYTQ